MASQRLPAFVDMECFGFLQKKEEQSIVVSVEEKQYSTSGRKSEMVGEQGNRGDFRQILK